MHVTYVHLCIKFGVSMTNGMAAIDTSEKNQIWMANEKERSNDLVLVHVHIS